MVIQKNIPGMNSKRIYTRNSSELSKSLEKLSSGYQVNRAADNAAGLAVSEKMRSQLAGIKQDIRNVQDGISYIQTGEGALDEIHAILQRCKTLGIESANGTYGQVDRDALQLEFDQLCSEVDHISETDFNGRFIFKDNSVSTPFDPIDRTDSSSSMIMFRHLDGDFIPVFVTTESLASNIAKVVNTAGKNFTAQALTDFANDIKNTYLPQVLGRIVSTLPNSSKPTVSGMEIGFNFYYSNDNVLASVRSNGTEFQLNINVNHLNMNGSSIDMTDSLASTMTHEMVHAIMFDTVSNGMLGIDPTNWNQNINGPHSFPDWFTEGMAEAIAGGSKRLNEILPYYNMTTLSPSTINTLNMITSKGYVQNTAKGCWERTDADIRTWADGINDTSRQLMPYEQGYAAVMYLGHLAGNSKNAAAPVDGNKIANGLDTVLAEIASGKSLDRVIGEYTGFNGTDDFINNFGSGGSDVVNFLRELMDTSSAKRIIEDIGGGNLQGKYDENSGAGALGTPVKLKGGAGTLLSGGSNSYFILDLENETVDNSNKMGSQQNKYEGGSAIEDGKDRNGNPPSSAPPATPTDPPGGTGEPGGNTGDPGDGTGIGDNDGTAAAAYKGYDSLILQVGPRSNGLVRFTMRYHTNAIGDLKCDFDCSASGLKINSLSISTQERANEAIDRLDHAINKVSMMRASFGAAQNRLEHKINNLSVSEENITASESQIRDTDMAEEMMKFTKLQIVSQASQSMLSQAMSLPQQIISLLA